MRQSKTEESILPVERPIIAIEGIDDYMNTVQTRMVYEYILGRGYTSKNGYNVLTSTGVPVIGNQVNGADVVRENNNLMRGLGRFFETKDSDGNLVSRGILVANGYKLETFAYQTIERPKGNLEAAYIKLPENITFLIDVSPEQAVKRMREMRHSNGIPEPGFLSKLRKLHNEYGELRGVIRLDGQEDEQVIFSMITDHLGRFFPIVKRKRKEKPL